MMHVVCIGDLMVDVVAQLSGPIVIGSDRPAPISLHGGGAAANVASWLAYAGAAATFVGRIGDDSLGLRAVDELTAAGVLPMVEIDPVRSTGMCIVLVDEHGERSLLPSAGANAVPADPGLLPSKADVLYISGYALLNVGSRPFALQGLTIARAAGWSIAVDAASAAPLADLGTEQFLEWIGPDVLLFANVDEARVLTGLDDDEAAAAELGLRCGSAVIKRGAAGAVWSDGSTVRSVAARDVTMLDSTGAGDAFAAGFLACAGDVDARLDAGVALAATVVTQVGARPPTR